MTETRYNLIFEGKIEAGHDQNEARLTLESLFEFDPESQADLFGGQQVVLGEGMDAATAQSFQQALAAAGVTTHLLPTNNTAAVQRRSIHRRTNTMRRARIRSHAIQADRRQGTDRRD